MHQLSATFWVVAANADSVQMEFLYKSFFCDTIRTDVCRQVNEKKKVYAYQMERFPASSFCCDQALYVVGCGLWILDFGQRWSDGSSSQLRDEPQFILAKSSSMNEFPDVMI